MRLRRPFPLHVLLVFVLALLSGCDPAPPAASGPMPQRADMFTIEDYVAWMTPGADTDALMKTVLPTATANDVKKSPPAANGTVVASYDFLAKGVSVHSSVHQTKDVAEATRLVEEKVRGTGEALAGRQLKLVPLEGKLANLDDSQIYAVQDAGGLVFGDVVAVRRGPRAVWIMVSGPAFLRDAAHAEALLRGKLEKMLAMPM